ncbi:MAG: hypothetical protein ACN6O6_13510 [Pseudomonas sp.]|uniref:hypothetical protein n=1 Tax=Pseudomonas sp. TaxID=306 RepID=UPI003D13932C
MNTPVGFFLGCCERLLRGDAELIALLRRQGFVCGPSAWQFSLPALHRFLRGHLAAQDALEYPQFRRQLFTSDLNTRLRALGAEIVIVDNRGKVDASVYGLCRLGAAPEALS